MQQCGRDSPAQGSLRGALHLPNEEIPAPRRSPYAPLALTTDAPRRAIIRATPAQDICRMHSQAASAEEFCIPLRTTRGEAAATQIHFAGDVATFRRLPLYKNSIPRGASAWVDVVIARQIGFPVPANAEGDRSLRLASLLRAEAMCAPSPSIASRAATAARCPRRYELLTWRTASLTFSQIDQVST